MAWNAVFAIADDRSDRTVNAAAVTTTSLLLLEVAADRAQDLVRWETE